MGALRTARVRERAAAPRPGRRLADALKAAGLALLFIAALGYAGHVDRETLLTERASAACEQQTAYTTPTFDQCMSNQLNGEK